MGSRNKKLNDKGDRKYGPSDKKFILEKGRLLERRKRREIITNIPPTKAAALKAATHKQQHPHCSIEEAYARTSSLAPTRLALEIDPDRLINFLSNVATLISYHIQSKGIAPVSVVGSTDVGWNPSLILCYLISITTARLQKLGALNASTTVQVMTNYIVPTFFAKWLQQIGPCYYMARMVTPVCNATVQDFMNRNCGSAGIDNIAANNSGWVGAPVYVQTSGDTEGWYSYEGTAPGSINYPGEVTSGTYSKISSAISKTFDHVITVGKIPDYANNAELKCTPIADAAYGQFMYTVLDPTLQCDLLLPLCSPYTGTLVNSTLSTLIPAPVRIDGGLCIAPEAKFAFMFHLANKFAFEAKHSFTSYLEKFGLKAHLRPNAIINLRQINWAGVATQVAEYCRTLSNVSPDTVWHMYIYCMVVLISNIPGAFRAISPVARDWNIAPLYKNTSVSPCYSSFARNPKMPPFLATLVKALREPIRHQNEISFYINVMPSYDSGFWWWNTVSQSGPTTFNTGGLYSKVPSTIFSTNITLDPGSPAAPFYPYSGFTGTGSGLSDACRNLIPIHGMASCNSEFQGVLIQPGVNLSLYNGWLAKATHFTRRHAKYYVVSELDDGNRIKITGAASKSMAVSTIIARQIMSNEPATHHSAILAVVHMMTYYSPSDDNIPIAAPTFSAQPVAGAETSTSGAISAENPSQGSSTAIMVAKSPNPGEVISHLGADSASDIIPDSSEQPPDSLKKQVTKKLTNELGTVVDEAANVAGDFLSKAVAVLA